MNIQQPDSVVAKKAALKALRTGVRLKYSLMADEELNRRLPELEQRINEALDSEEPLELTVGRIIDEV